METRNDLLNQPSLMATHGHGHELKRSLGFWALLVYGIGDILGAGIYALVGKVAGSAGSAAPVAFLIALGAAALTAASYSELVTRFPHSGGAAYFCQQGFRRHEPALFVGWLVFCSGVVSMATLSRAFAGYFSQLVPALPEWVVIAGFLLAVCLINYRGIELSSLSNIICTSIEVSGLLIVIVAGAAYLFGQPAAAAEAVATEPVVWWGVLQGGALAFYACIGFEDLVNVAEETRRPERDLPWAILAALGCAGVMYLIVSSVAVAIVPPQDLARSDAPLLDVLRRSAPGFPALLFAVIPLFAVANSALLNGIMASRLLYGLSREGLLPRVLTRVHPQRRTPHVAIAVVLVVTIALALSGSLVFLAGTASLLLLGVFVLVHLALCIVKWRGPRVAAGFRIPLVLPVLGAATCCGLMVFAPRESLLPAAAMLAMGAGIVAIHRGIAGPAPRASQPPASG